jgi:hypothetical protein
MRGPAIIALVASYGHELVADATRTVVARLRQEITSGLLDESTLRSKTSFAMP